MISGIFSGVAGSNYLYLFVSSSRGEGNGNKIFIFPGVARGPGHPDTTPGLYMIHDCSKHPPYLVNAYITNGQRT